MKTRRYIREETWGAAGGGCEGGGGGGVISDWTREAEQWSRDCSRKKRCNNVMRVVAEDQQGWMVRPGGVEGE